MKTVSMSGVGIEVSELCFGTLTLGTLQASLSPEEGGRVIRKALDMGVTFFDTAQRYGSYPHLREGLAGWIDKVVVASKSSETTYEDMQNAVEEALRELSKSVRRKLLWIIASAYFVDIVLHLARFSA